MSALIWEEVFVERRRSKDPQSSFATSGSFLTILLVIQTRDQNWWSRCSMETALLECWTLTAPS